MSAPLYLYGQTQMSIQYHGGYTIQNPYKVVALQDSNLTLYDYQLINRTINFYSFRVFTTGYISQLSMFFSYNIDSSWGDIDDEPLTFTFKNNQLIAAFQTNLKFIIIFFNNETSDVHIVDRSGISLNASVNNITRSFYIVNDTIGFCSSNNALYKIDLISDVLTLFYQDIDPNIDYNIYSFCDDYLLMYSPWLEQGNGLLVQGNNIIHVYNDYGNFTLTWCEKVCYDYYNVTTAAWPLDIWSMLMYVQNNMLNAIIIDNMGDLILTYFTNCVTNSDSSFSCIQKSVTEEGIETSRIFRNFIISNHNLIQDNGFPSINNYGTAQALFKMNNDFSVGVAGEPGSPRAYILIDYTDNSIRNYLYSVDNNTTNWSYLNSESCFFMIKDNRVHIFKLEQTSVAYDETGSIVRPDITIYPNPMSSFCKINLVLHTKQMVEYDIFNTKGQKIAKGINTYLYPGKHSFTWDSTDLNGRKVTSGIYLIRFKLDSLNKVNKVFVAH